jgi:hypothetical protein
MKGKGIRRWIFPGQDNVYAGWRLITALFLNLALAAYVLPRREHLWDIRDFRYVDFSLAFAFVVVGIPSALLLILAPLFASRGIARRWMAIALALFPAYLVMVGGTQLILLWMGGK